MQRSLKPTVIFIIVLVLVLVISKHNNALSLSSSFSDDFNRPDGLTGNGWTSWWAYSSFDDPHSMIVNGELRAFGYPQQGGGIFRTFPVSFPVMFSFDFRTENDFNECGFTSYNDGGWRITLNAAPSLTPMDSVAQVKFEQYAGSRNIIRRYLTNPGATNQAGMAEDVAPGIPEPIPHQRDYTEHPSHIEGIVFSDLSAIFTVHYSDGQSPDPVQISFGPAPGAIDYQPGSLLMLSNSNCSHGPHYLDNFKINPTNTAPQITSIIGSSAPIQLDESIDVAVEFIDPDINDTHTARWIWGDGSVTTTSATLPSVTNSHVYTSAGVYIVTVIITDSAGETDTDSYQFIVIYDPGGGFVTGGGWLLSPSGAYMPDPTLTGKATFGFVSKYQKGAIVPTGSTEFQFHVANMNFKSTSYDWLVIAGSKAQYKGIGTVNGSGTYGFVLTAMDGSLDRFRIKIWEQVSGEVIYDNQMGASDTADLATVIQGGSIVIHKPK